VRRLAGRRLRHLRVAAAQQPENLQRVHTEKPAADERNRDGAEADAVYGPKSSARAAHVLHVLTLFLSIHLHD
jgi:hypothetical protein